MGMEGGAGAGLGAGPGAPAAAAERPRLGVVTKTDPDGQPDSPSPLVAQMRAKQLWSEEEDTALRAAVHEMGPQKWKRIAQKVAGRNDVQCLQRWKKVLDPDLRKGKWSDAEDDIMRSVKQTNPKIKWGSLALYIPGRCGKQCRERWDTFLDPTLKRSEWTPEEDAVIMQARQGAGTRTWSELSKILPGRSQLKVRDRYKGLCRALRRQAEAGCAGAGAGAGAGAETKEGIAKPAILVRRRSRGQRGGGCGCGGTACAGAATKEPVPHHFPANVVMPAPPANAGDATAIAAPPAAVATASATAGTAAADSAPSLAKLAPGLQNIQQMHMQHLQQMHMQHMQKMHHMHHMQRMQEIMSLKQQQQNLQQQQQQQQQKQQAQQQAQQQTQQQAQQQVQPQAQQQQQQVQQVQQVQQQQQVQQVQPEQVQQVQQQPRQQQHGSHLCIESVGAGARVLHNTLDGCVEVNGLCFLREEVGRELGMRKPRGHY
jgi:flagellar biosynthesis GTPase FlhF